MVRAIDRKTASNYFNYFWAKSVVVNWLASWPVWAEHSAIHWLALTPIFLAPDETAFAANSLPAISACGDAS
jgi:hypothetical protein